MADGNEEARIEKAAALGQITEEKKEELLTGLNIGFDAEVPAAAEGAEPAPEAAAAANEDESIQVGDKVFTNKDEALAYARQLEANSLNNDAYRQGLQDAISQQPGNPAVPAAAAPDTFDEDFYADPKKYLGDLVAKVKADTAAEINQATDQKDRVKNLWVEFYKKNPDLENKAKFVKLILEENWDVLGKMRDSDAAMKILAKQTREELKTWVDEAKPGEELTNATTTSSPGGSVGVTPKNVEPESLDFVAQLQQAQDKRMAPQ